MKVCNLLGAEAWERDILITMIRCKNIESGGFPGAYIFPQKKVWKINVRLLVWILHLYIQVLL